MRFKNVIPGIVVFVLLAFAGIAIAVTRGPTYGDHGTTGTVSMHDGQGSGYVLTLRPGTLTADATAFIPTIAAALSDTGVLFASAAGVITEDATNFSWDNTANAQMLTIGAGTSAGEIVFLEPSGAGTNTVSVKAPATIATNINFVLPPTDGTNGQILTSDGNGVTTWTSVAGFGVTTFNDLSIPYASALDTFSFDETNFSWDDTTNSEVLTLGAGTSGGEIKLLEGSGGGTDGFSWTAPATLTGDYELEVPDGDGSAGQILITDGSEVLSWAERFIQLATNTAADVVEGNESGAQAFVFSGDGDLTWDANFFAAGGTSHVLMAGFIKSDDTGSETLDFTFKIASTEFLGTGDLALAVEEEAGSPWIFECEVVGTGSNTQFATGTFTYMFNATSVATVIPFHKTLTETTANALLFSATVEWKNGAVTNDQATMSIVNITGMKF